MNTQSLQNYVAQAQDLEFPYCDARHEDIYRDRDGKALLIEGKIKFVSTCALDVIAKRPGCLHCRQVRGIHADPILKLAEELKEKEKLPADVEAQRAQYRADYNRKKDLDDAISHARVGVKNSEIDRTLLDPLLVEHRQMVDRAKTLCASLLSIAKEVLEENKI